MSDLLIISIGPVQDFIAAARRTRDLQAGSDLLTAIARAAAAAIKNGGGELIFPVAPETGAANKLVAVIPAGTAEAHLAAAETAAKSLLEAEWETVSKLCGNHISQAVAAAQLEGFLEVYAAAVPLANDYAAARKKAEALLAGRKALRDFQPYTGHAGREKSPLDPARETVIDLLPTAKDQSRIPERLRSGPLWLAGTEYLDTLSLLKRGTRLTTALEKTPSTATIAARTVNLDDVRQAGHVSQDDYENLVNHLEGADLTLEDLLFRRPEALTITAGMPGALALQKQGDKLKPYYAVLVADGDHVGKYLDALSSPEEHRKFSADLAAFADNATTIVTQHQGYAVYCGGDDVLALVPYTQAATCATALSASYATRFPSAGGFETTLSVGIAIVHIHHPLQRAIALGRAAEAEAKKSRNALAVALHTRGGTPTVVTDSWASSPLTAWESALADMKSGVSRGLPYELRDLLRTWPHALRTAKADLNILDGELKRVISKKTKTELKSLPYGTDFATLEKHIERLVIARWMAGQGEIGGTE